MIERTKLTDGRRLDSWKEIARFLGRDVRTAIRWERQRGLPVHRIPGGKRGAVYALTSEIDLWLQGNANGAAPVTPTEVTGPVTQVPDRLERQSRGPAPRPAPRRAVFLAAAGLALAAGAVLVSLGVIRLSAYHDRIQGSSTAIRSVSLSGTKLLARDSAGQVLWSYDFGRPVVTREDPWYRGTTMATFAASEDLDGDEVPDLVISVRFGENRPGGSADHDELFAFSGNGDRVLWSRRLEDTLAFRAGHFGAPWCSVFPGPSPTNGLTLFHVDGRLRIAWAQNHNTWWPSILTILDSRGRTVSKWVHSGMIYALASMEEGVRPRLLVGGISNSRKAAFLAVLDARHVEGAGPEEPGSPFECLSCGPTRPLRYFTFEPSELMLAVSPYNHVQRILVNSAGVQVETAEYLEIPARAFNTLGIAFFSTDLTLERVAWSSSWDDSHRELEREGRIDHPLKKCAVRGSPPRVREWTEPSGWRDVEPVDVVRESPGAH